MSIEHPKPSYPTFRGPIVATSGGGPSGRSSSRSSGCSSSWSGGGTAGRARLAGTPGAPGPGSDPVAVARDTRTSGADDQVSSPLFAPLRPPVVAVPAAPTNSL